MEDATRNGSIAPVAIAVERKTKPFLAAKYEAGAKRHGCPVFSDIKEAEEELLRIFT